MTNVSTNGANPYSGKAWIKKGLYWWIFMFIAMGLLINPLAFHHEITIKYLLIQLGAWLVAGLVYGFLTKWLTGLWIKRKR